MSRSYLAIVVMLALLATTCPRTVRAAAPLDAQTMKVALHTATPEEGGFIDYVLVLVNMRVLPLDMVESTFLWARKKPYNKFQYFKRGLILRAETAGIPLQ